MGLIGSAISYSLIQFLKLALTYYLMYTDESIKRFIYPLPSRKSLVGFNEFIGPCLRSLL